jgi:hypothetical protein
MCAGENRDPELEEFLERQEIRKEHKRKYGEDSEPLLYPGETW